MCMSTPVPSRNTDNVDELSLYAPRRSREQPASPPPDHQLTDAPTMAAALDRVESKVVDLREAQRTRSPSFWPIGEDAPPVAPETEAPVPRAPRMPQGPNLDMPLRPRTRHSAPPGVDGDDPLQGPLVPEFEGDAAVKAMRQRLSLEPDIVPSPPMRKRSKSVMPFFGRLFMVI